MAVGHGRVGDHDPELVTLDGVLDEGVIGAEARMVGEGVNQGIAFVVVATHQGKGEIEALQAIAQDRVLVGRPPFDEVAGDQHEVGARRQPVEMLDRTRQGRSRVDLVTNLVGVGDTARDGM